MGAPHGDAGAYFGSMLQSPPMAVAINHLGSLMRTGQLRGTYTHADREFIDMVMSRDFQYNFVLPTHIPDALANGVRPEAIETVLFGDESELTSDERQLAGYTRQVMDGTVTDGEWNAMEQRLGARGVVEFTIFILFLQFTLRLMQAFGIPGPGRDEVRALFEEYRSGERPLPDPDAHIR